MFDIPLGILYLLIICILSILKLIYIRAYKSSKKLDILIYILILMFISSIVYFIFMGFSYPCPCGCGSEEIDHGIKAIVSFFTKRWASAIVYNLNEYFITLIICSALIHGIIMLIKFIVNKTKK